MKRFVWYTCIVACLWVPSSVGADDRVGFVADGPFEGNEYLLKYKNRILGCKVRRQCSGFEKGTMFVPTLDFKRDRELLDYVDANDELSYCMVRECRDL
jgi:hypothetical protein